MSTHHLTLRTPTPFELRLSLFGHGWIDLAPNTWNETQRRFETALFIDGQATDLDLCQGKTRLQAEVRARRSLRRSALARLRRTLRRMLRLDLDLEAFWKSCRAVPEMRWVARRGAGRLLRAPSLFEDQLKLLCTTNCSWAATRLMVSRLCDALGEKTPSGRRCFPGPELCAARGETFWRKRVRAGYRARACVALSRAWADGSLREEQFEDPELPLELVRTRLSAMLGFGPYAAGQALRLLGHHGDLALDSWCRGKLARLAGRQRPPSDRTIERRYRAFGMHRGLALWMDLTADWHGERQKGERRDLSRLC